MRLRSPLSLLTLLVAFSANAQQPSEPTRPDVTLTWAPRPWTVRPNPLNAFVHETIGHPASADSHFVFMKTTSANPEIYVEWNGTYGGATQSEVRAQLDMSRTGSITEKECYFEIGIIEPATGERNVVSTVPTSATTGLRWTALVLNNMPNRAVGTPARFSAYLRRNRGTTECHANLAMRVPMRIVRPSTTPTGSDDEVVANTGLRLWPNPARSTLNLQLPHGTEGVEVYDLTGRGLLTASGDVASLDVSPLAPGMYFLRAIGLYGSVVKAVVVQ